MLNKIKIGILERKVKTLVEKVEVLERKVEIFENNQKPLHTPFEQDTENELGYKEIINEWLNGEEKGKQ